MDELQALSALQTGSREAFTWLVRRYERDLMHLAYRLTGDNDAARDLVQETFWRLWQHRSRIRPEGSLRGWLVTVMVRLSVDCWRKEHREIPLQELSVFPRVLDPRVRRLERCLSRLSRQQRAVVVMFYTEGFRLREIAQMLGVTEGTVKTHLHRAREALRRCLEERP